MVIKSTLQAIALNFNNNKDNLMMNYKICYGFRNSDEACIFMYNL